MELLDFIHTKIFIALYMVLLFIVGVRLVFLWGYNEGQKRQTIVIMREKDREKEDAR